MRDVWRALQGNNAMQVNAPQVVNVTVTRRFILSTYPWLSMAQQQSQIIPRLHRLLARANLPTTYSIEACITEFERIQSAHRCRCEKHRKRGSRISVKMPEQSLPPKSTLVLALPAGESFWQSMRGLHWQRSSLAVYLWPHLANRLSNEPVSGPSGFHAAPST